MYDRYGFQRLALMNSAGYQRAELPLDAAVSLIAPNNTGKTSLINALQFLLIIDKRRMDFGAHEVDSSRRFYFPHNSAYILLEVALPTTGTVVLGCVGKGVSHDYEYFAYKGELDLEHYRLPDGSTVPHPQLRDHMLQFGQLVYAYSASEFADALYGGRRHKRQDNEPDFTVFKLEQVTNAAIFQRVLTRRCFLTTEVRRGARAYLLEIFRQDLPDASIDFKAEWAKAFAEVTLRAQYEAAMKQRTLISGLERDHDALPCYAASSCISAAHRCASANGMPGSEEKSRLAGELAGVERAEEGLTMRDRDLVKQQGEVDGKLNALRQQEARFEALSRGFELIAAREVLEQRQAEVRTLLEEQTVLVHQASSRSLAGIQRDLAANEREQQRCRNELETLTDNLYLRLRATLDEGELNCLNRTLAAPIMTLSPSAFRLDPVGIKAALQTSDAPAVTLPGLRLNVDGLPLQHEQRSREEIQRQLDDLIAQAPLLAQQLAAAQELDAARARKVALERQLEQITKELADFDELLQLRASIADRQQETTALQTALKEIERLLDQSKANATRLRLAHKEVQARITALEDQHRLIVSLRNRRGDDGLVFDMLSDLPHQPWLGSDEVSLTTLAEVLQAYQRDCSDLSSSMSASAASSPTCMCGLTKFQFSKTQKQRSTRFSASPPICPRRRKRSERAARTAVVNVTACLGTQGWSAAPSKMRNSTVSWAPDNSPPRSKDRTGGRDVACRRMTQLISTAEQAVAARPSNSSTIEACLTT